jgi:hypothetical protein
MIQRRPQFAAKGVFRFACRAHFFVFAVVLMSLPSVLHAATDATVVFRRADAALATVSQNTPLFAPTSFSKAVHEYQAAASALKAKSDKETITASEQAIHSLETANSVDAQNEELLKDTKSVRDTTIAINGIPISSLARADEILKQAAAAAEAGKKDEALSIASKASQAYASIAAQFIKQKWAPDIEKEISEARADAPVVLIERAQAALDRDISSADTVKPAELNDLIARLKGIEGLLFPPFFRTPPANLQMADFVLQVIHYDQRRWDFKSGDITNASGTAWLVFNCQPTFHRPPFWQIATVAKNFRVVKTVKNPTEEIALTDAVQLEPGALAGSTIAVDLPTYATTPLQISQAIAQQIQWLLKPAGGIEVHFDNLTIEPLSTPNTGRVLQGTASYPTVPPDPANASLAIAGFNLLLHSIELSPTRALVNAELEMPITLVDSGTGHPGRVDLGTFPITSACVFRRDLPQLAYGPWEVGNTGMQIQGSGVLADFDPSWASPSAPAGSTAAAPAWEGTILGAGATKATSPVISNSGYLSAAYSYQIALVAASGLSGQFKLTAPYEFESVEPFGYRVSISTGHVDLLDSAVADGQFDEDKLVLPKTAVLTTTGAAVTATHNQLQLDSNLNLLSGATLSAAIRWGEFASHPPTDTYYESQGFKYGRFYLCGTPRMSYFPLDAADNFSTTNPLLTSPEISGMQGLTVFFPQSLQVDTPDTPTPSPLKFISINQSDRSTADWINFSFGGVNAQLQNFMSQPGTKTDLGPVYQAFYKGKAPFLAGLGSGASEKLQKRYSLAMQFVTSAVYSANMQGAVNLPMPVNSNLDFSEMAFTSTAQISGAQLPMTSPLGLSYWGLDVVKKPGMTSAGVISVRTGEVFFTAAGIQESRHFAMPFYLMWGDLLANGSVSKLEFDYNGAGQKFDGFGYTTSFVKLSDYDPAQPAGYLKTAGRVAFDVFGAKYININDAYDTTKPSDPYDNRNVTLANDSDPNGPYEPTDHALNADWGNGFANFAYTYDYDINAQDGFVGPGTMGVQWIDQNLQSSIVLKSDRICMSANDTNFHDITLGPVAHFGTMSSITGCGCIVNHQLERLILSAQLESTTDANIVLRSASYGEVQMMFTPSVSTVEFTGDMYLSILAGGNMEVAGDAKFTVNRDQDFAEGDVDGHFDSSTALGLNSVSGDGHVNWHVGVLGGTGYESLQGQLALSVLTPLAGTSAEGGLYVGINAPLSDAWVLTAAGPHFKLNTAALPARLTGMYGYVKGGQSVNLYILSGGFEEFVGLGGFVLTPQQATNLGAQNTANVVGLPYVVGNVGAHAWGSILGGLVSADGWADLQVILPYPYQFQGDIDLSACVLWVACGDADVTVGLNSSQGFYLQ